MLKILEWVVNLFRTTKIQSLEITIKKLESEIKSIYIKHGQALEQLVPLSKEFPEGKFLFLGQPVDGVIFNEEEIVFIEIKSGSSQLSPKQVKIRKLIEEKKISFRELRY